MVLHQTDYRKILADALSERVRRNPGFSLRAFSRHLGVRASQLSDVLSGKKGLSRRSASQIAQRLGFSETESEYFCSLIDASHSRSPRQKTEAETHAQALRKKYARLASRNLSMDAFQAIADPEHFVLLQTLKLPQIRALAHDAQIHEIAATLKISRSECDALLERLKRLKLVTVDQGALQVVDDHVMAPDGISSQAVRQFHERILRRALESIHSAPFDKRDLSAMVIPMASSDLPRARAQIRGFIDQLCSDFSNSPACDTVNVLSVQLVPWTKDPV